MTLKHAEDMDQYSVSVDYLETLSCFLYFQEIKEHPKKSHQPILDQWVLGHTSNQCEYRQQALEEFFKKINPHLEVPYR